MAYGVLVRNNLGEIVIDGETPCAFLHEKGSKSITTTPEDANSNSYRSVSSVAFDTPVTTPEPPFIAGYSPNGLMSMCAMIGGPGDWRGFSVTQPSGTLDSNNNDEFYQPKTWFLKYAVFSRFGEYRFSDSYGFQVFGPSGNQAFDSRKFPFEMVGLPDYVRFGTPYTTQTMPFEQDMIISGHQVSSPGSNYWPLLGTLNQMFWITGRYNDYETIPPGVSGFMRMGVERESSTSWRFKAGYIISQGDYAFPQQAINDYSTLPNFGAGFGGVNMLMFAKIP